MCHPVFRAAAAPTLSQGCGMAMKEVWTHPKFKALKMRLGLADWEAIGLLESVWGICVQVKSCRSGSILWEPSKIAAYIGWSRDAADMVDALVECGWLDRVDGGVAVHDWARHSPRWVRGVLKREADHQPPNSVPNSVGHSVADSVRYSVGTTAGGGKGKGRNTKDMDTTGVGGVGEGEWPPVFIGTAEWFERLHRFPSHAVVTQAGIDGQMNVCARTLEAESLARPLASRLLRSLAEGWAVTGHAPSDALRGILDGLDGEGVKDRGAVLRSRVSKILERGA